MTAFCVFFSMCLTHVPNVWHFSNHSCNSDFLCRSLPHVDCWLSASGSSMWCLMLFLPSSELKTFFSFCNVLYLHCFRVSLWCLHLLHFSSKDSLAVCLWCFRVVLDGASHFNISNFLHTFKIFCSVQVHFFQFYTIKLVLERLHYSLKGVKPVQQPPAILEDMNSIYADIVHFY